MSSIILTKLDYARIKNCIHDAKQFQSISTAQAKNLLDELNSAKVVDSLSVPSNVVTMNSIVKIKFMNNDKTTQFQIVYPDEADIGTNKISIFSPIATILIGYKENDVIEWLSPNGITKIKIEEILYQPEAAGNYDL